MDGDFASHGGPSVDGGLVLTRKEGESTVIKHHDGSEFYVVVVRIDGDRVKIGFLVPPQTLVNRSEVWKYLRHELD